MGKHVLIAEDQHLLAILLEETLAEAGYRVTLASNGEEALRLWSSDRADILVTDFGMPKMNGAELIRRLRDLEPELPVVMITGYTDLKADDLRTILTPERSMLLEKPSGLFRLVDEVARLLAVPAAAA